MTRIVTFIILVKHQGKWTQNRVQVVQEEVQTVRCEVSGHCSSECKMVVFWDMTVQSGGLSPMFRMILLIPSSSSTLKMEGTDSSEILVTF
jgi:hypothetical protein